MPIPRLARLDAPGILHHVIGRGIERKEIFLRMLANWLDPALVATLETRRRKKKEWHRRRKLTTLGPTPNQLTFFFTITLP